MAVLYQNFVGGETDASLTNSGTTMSSPALAAVSEISSPKVTYITLDPDGIAGEPEVVKVTAHTAAASTATIVRGVRGTSARAHATGVEWVHGLLSNDLDVVPSNLDVFNTEYGQPLTYDYEFDGYGSTIPSGWAWLNQGGATYSEKLSCGVLTSTDQSGDQQRILARALPSESTWTAYFKASILTRTTNFNQAGFCLHDGTKLLTFYFSGDTSAVLIGLWTTTSSVSSHPISIPVDRAPVYWRIRRNSASSYDFYVSNDGVAWYTITTAYDVSAWLTPTHIGITASSNNSGTAPVVSTDWLRVR